MEGVDLASDRASDWNWFRLSVFWAESERGPKITVVRQIVARRCSLFWLESGMGLDSIPAMVSEPLRRGLRLVFFTGPSEKRRRGDSRESRKGLVSVRVWRCPFHEPERSSDGPLDHRSPIRKLTP